jgi:peroxiredoxin
MTGTLTAIAAFLEVQGTDNPGLGITGWRNLSGLEWLGVAVLAVAVMVLAVEGWLTVQLLRHNARMRARLALSRNPANAELAPAATVLAVGSQAPNFQLRTLDGGKVTLDGLRGDGRAVMLLFVEPDCGPCSALLPDIARWQTEYAPSISFALISSGSAKANRAKIGGSAVTQVLLQSNFEVAEAYQVSGTPSAVIVHPTGILGSPLAGGPDQIRALLDQYVELLAVEAGFELEDDGELARATRERSSPLQIGGPAPDLELLDVTGKTSRLADLRGHDTVLLFWDPACYFCREMVPDLKDWDAHRREGSPNLLIVLNESARGDRSLIFLSPPVIDRDSAAAQALSANGTPSAIRIDAGGNIASQPVVGAVPVLELLGWAPADEERALSRPSPETAETSA